VRDSAFESRWLVDRFVLVEVRELLELLDLLEVLLEVRLELLVSRVLGIGPPAGCPSRLARC